jgi:ATP-dependent exoDNAse (exonuclease V) alpha subunit
MFFRDERMQEGARGGVILVDEASQLGTRDMAQLFDLAERLGARVILVGDRRQHRSVTAGEPLRLLEEKAGLRVAEVTEIVRQDKEYKRAAGLLSKGEIEEAFKELDQLGWIRQVPDSDRYRQLADAYLAAVAERKKNGEYKSALVVSPTHAEADRITVAIRDGLRAQGRLGKERLVDAWVPMHLTDPQKADATEYEPGQLVQFHQNAPGFKKGSRLIVGEGGRPPTQLAHRFEVYRPTQLALAVGDRVRITAGGKTKDGKYRLSNGSLLTVEGFTKRGDIIVDGGKIIDRDFGHLTHGYVLTSHASQGDTVDKVFVAIASQSLPATNQRTGYVALTRGREQAVLFTDDRKELLRAISRPDEPLSATELAESTNGKATLRDRLAKSLAVARRLAVSAVRPHVIQPGMPERGMDHDR